MYLSFYGFNKKPFQISSDPAFLWLGEKHEEALATLRYGVMDNKGFLLITGDVGTGKTTLINALVDSFDPNEVVHAIVTDPKLDRLDFFNIISNSFKIPKKFESKADFLIYFSGFLNLQHKRKKTVVLIVDESQRLSQELLEEIRLLSNIERQDQKLLNIFFLGQNEFNQMLETHENRALRQRITIKYHLQPLTFEETKAYIDHRLKVAGGNSKIFNDDALKKIHAYSQGYPRLINIICDHSLLYCYVDGRLTVDGTVIEECRKDLEIEKPFTDTSLSHENREKTENIPAPKSTNRALTILIVIISVLVTLFVTGAAVVYYFRNVPSQSSIRDEINSLKEIVGDLKRSNTFRSKIDFSSEKDVTIPAKPAASAKADLNRPGPSSNATSQKKVAKEPTQDIETSKNMDSRGMLTSQRAPNNALPEPKRQLSVNDIIEEQLQAEAARTHTSVPVHTQTTKPGFVSEAVSPVDQLKTFLEKSGNPFALYFKYNSNELAETDYKVLDQFAELASRVPNAEITVTGHTDSSGSNAYNRKLSEFRANNVKSYLVGKGISPNAIKAVGKGGQEPQSSSGSVQSMSANRRVEIRVTGPGL